MARHAIWERGGFCHFGSFVGRSGGWFFQYAALFEGEKPGVFISDTGPDAYQRGIVCGLRDHGMERIWTLGAGDRSRPDGDLHGDLGVG